MSTAGEPPAKRHTKSHRGRRCSLSETKKRGAEREYFLSAFAIAQLQRDGVVSCSLDAASDENEGTIEAELGRFRSREVAPEGPQECVSNLGGQSESSRGYSCNGITVSK